MQPTCYHTVIADFEGLVTQALLMANFEAAVDVCLNNNKMAEAIILAVAGGPELLLRTQKRFFQSNKSTLNKVYSENQYLFVLLLKLNTVFLPFSYLIVKLNL